MQYQFWQDSQHYRHDTRLYSRQPGNRGDDSRRIFGGH
ncbi:hypothetical protein OROHE_010407 [Orobanche hederae]